MKDIDNITNFNMWLRQISNEIPEFINQLNDDGNLKFCKKGSLKGNLAKICSFPSKNRIGILLYFLGSQRRITILRENLEF